MAKLNTFKLGDGTKLGSAVSIYTKETPTTVTYTKE